MRQAAPASPSTGVTYEPDPFGRAVKVAITEKLLDEGIPRRGGARLWGKAVVVTTWYLGSYSLLVWAPMTWPLVIAVTLSLSLATAGLGMSVKHDAVHQTFSRRRWVNTAVAQVATSYGLSAGWWRHKHNRFHHGFTNVNGLDTDIDLGRLARLSPEQAWAPWHRWQHLYLWALYPFIVLSQLVGADMKYVLFARIGPHRVAEPGIGRALVLLVDKFKGLVLLLGLAMAFRPTVMVAAVFFTVYLVGGMALALTFVIEHTVDTSTFPTIDPTDGRVPVGWAEAQVRGSANLATHNRLISWYVGSLNHHIEHHLTPKLPHVQLHRIAPVVRAVCEAHGVPYQEFPTLRTAMAAHHRFLRALGRPSIPAVMPSSTDDGKGSGSSQVRRDTQATARRRRVRGIKALSPEASRL